MKEAMSKTDYERKEQGLAPLRPVRPVRLEPEKPPVKDEIFMKDIPKDYKLKLEYARKCNINNDEGILFIGYNVAIEFTPKKGEKDHPSMEGWMTEGTFLEFVRTYRKHIDQQAINW
jgi:hypothetical protein